MKLIAITLTLIFITSCGSFKRVEETKPTRIVVSPELKIEDCIQRFLTLGATPEQASTMCLNIYK